MRIWDRVLLAIYTIIIAIFSVITIVVSLKLVNMDTIYYCIQTLYNNNQVSIVVIIVALLLLAVSLELLLSGIRRPVYKGAIIRADNSGSVMLSVSAIDTMVQRSARMIEGIKDIRSSVMVEPDGTRIALSILVDQDVNIPELTANLQSQIKEYVEKYGGIKIKSVMVKVDNISSSAHNKME